MKKLDFLRRSLTGSLIARPARTLTIGALLAGTALAGCQATADLVQTTASIETEVQADAQLACSFIPSVATIGTVVANLVAPGAGSIVPDAATIASSICAAIAQAPVPIVQSAKLKSLKGGVPVGVTVSVGSLKIPGSGGKSVPITGSFTQ